MDQFSSRQFRFYSRLSYPVHISRTESGYVGTYRDLPGCTAKHDILDTLFQDLDARRRHWIIEHLRAGSPVPLPNAHLDDASAPQRSTAQERELAEHRDQKNRAG